MAYEMSWDDRIDSRIKPEGQEMLKNTIVEDHFDPALTKLADLVKSCNIGQSQNAQHMAQAILSIEHAKELELNGQLQRSKNEDEKVASKKS